MRIGELEREMTRLTANVNTLTGDVRQLVESQREVQALIRAQAVQRTDLDHVSESVDRAFGLIEELHEQVHELEKNAAVSKAVDDARMGFLSFLGRYWPVLSGIALAAAAYLHKGQQS